MATSSLESSPSVQVTQSATDYSQATYDRAVRAVQCSPFCLPLFRTMADTCVSLRDIAGHSGVKQRYTRQPLPLITTEDHLLWLIQTGLLRREVDGQGITDSFRLTPLGRQLLDQWNAEGLEALPTPTIADRMTNFTAQWVRSPF